MSHFTRVVVQVKEKEYLLTALKEMGYTPVENTNVRGYMGDKTQAEVVVRPGGSYDIGFRKLPAGNFEVVADWWGVGRTVNQRDFTRKLEDEYAAAAAVGEAQKQGYVITNKYVDDRGRIQIVATKY